MKQREIKFRMYDTSLCVMYTDKMNNEIKNLWALPLSSGGVLVSDEDRILMQYTGLKDKNGVDIYESDILTTETEKPMIVKWSDKFASWCLYRDGWMFAHWFGESCNPEDCEVIGNIHQNPELL